ncbi:hypothetical protein ACQCT6_12925 [Cytobacillus gottheilii]|uniref:hypothetical protein n=1 Tax=Cytobacillus gottheilii TaxID=859144 RepID=UPI003CE9B9F2
MFTELNEKLLIVKDDLRKKEKYEDHLERLKADLQLEIQKRDMYMHMLEEKKEDVSRFESFTLANIFYSLIGKKLEKIDQEEQLIAAMKLKYKEAMETIADMEDEIRKFEMELTSVANADVEYEAIINEKERLIRDTDSFWNDQLYTLSEKEAELFAGLKEYNEAIEVGQKAKHQLDEALDELESAHNWSTFDMFGGGTISTFVKHSRYNSAQDLIHDAQHTLRQFREELLDLKKHFDHDYDIGNMLTVADYFFDGIVVDWMVHGKINDAMSQTEKMYDLVKTTLKEIKLQRDELEKELTDVHWERIELFESCS